MNDVSNSMIFKNRKNSNDEIINKIVHDGLNRYTYGGSRNNTAICDYTTKNIKSEMGGNWDCIIGDYFFTADNRVKPLTSIGYQIDFDPFFLIGYPS